MVWSTLSPFLVFYDHKENIETRGEAFFYLLLEVPPFILWLMKNQPIESASDMTVAQLGVVRLELYEKVMKRFKEETARSFCQNKHRLDVSLF